jgi:DNA polymerase-3 subunit epsilon
MFGRFRGGKPGPSGIDAATPIAQVRYVAIDTELTGLDIKKDAIVSLGAVRMSGGTVHLGETFYCMVNPGTGLTAESVVIHEITPADVREQPGIEAVLREFLAFCGRDVLVGHFTAIDAGFLDRDLRRVAGVPLANPVIDTLSVYTWLRKRLKDHEQFSAPEAGISLYDIAKCFHISVAGAHNALQDAFCTAQLLQRFLPLLTEAGATDIGGLLRIGAPFAGGDHHHRPGGEFSNL